MKLLIINYFNSSLFELDEMIAKGAYGIVWSIKNDPNLVVKLVDLPNGSYDECKLHDIFSEICTMEEIKVDQNICGLVEYGVTEDM